MEVTLIWSWFSFWIGAASLFTAGFWAVVFIAFTQYRKQKKNAAKGWSDFEAMAKQWGSTKK